MPTAVLAEPTVRAMRDAVAAPPDAASKSGAAQIVLPFEIYGPENV